ncbi:MAG: divalent-cation tolerance protein CutA [Candidatus Omnitrophota bacterium]
MAIMVLVTIPKKKAKSLTKILLQNKACACVNILEEINSFFWWQGKVNNAKESLLIIKTKSTGFEKLKILIKKHHPYDVPEIIAFKIDKMNKEYSQWLNKNV